MNITSIIGRMTRDPELRKTGSGKAVISFTLAVERAYTDQSGKTADFIPVVAWGGLAEVTSKYCGKGSKVGVCGAIRERAYENSDGRKVHVLEIHADSVDFLDTRKPEDASVQEEDQSEPVI